MIRIRTALATLLVLLPLAAPLQAADAWLMTYGTADRIEERFGHNALWIRDPERGIDRIYNFGFFDFDKPGFYLDYLRGDLVYYAVARDPVEELAYYQWRDRSVRGQLLALDDAMIRRLTDWLEARVQPETRDFQYDYFFNNCSTRIRDALDHALDGALHAATVDKPAGLNLREHTRRLIRPDPLLYLGIEAALGRPVDRPRSAWDEMFLPEVVAREVQALRIPDGQGGWKRLVLDDRMLHVSARPAPRASPGFPWALSLGLLIASTGLVLVPARVFRHRRGRLLGLRAWWLAIGLGGALLAFLWFGTSHAATAGNENLLLLNPLALLLLRVRGGRFEAVVAGVLLAGLVLALALKLAPGAQWNLDLLLALLPAQAAALALWRREVAHRTERGPDAIAAG